MNARVRELLSDFEWGEALPPEELTERLGTLGFHLPADYLEVLREGNGGEGFIGEVSYLMLWPVEEIVARNERLDLPRRMPGYLLFGSNGGDAGYGFDVRSGTSGDMPIVEVPYLDIGEDGAARPRGKTFREFLELLAGET